MKTRLGKKYTFTFTGNGQSNNSSIPALSFNYNYYSTWKRMNLWIKQSFVFDFLVIRFSNENRMHTQWQRKIVWKIIIVRLIAFGLFFENLLHSRVHLLCVYKVQSKRARTENFYYWHLNVEPFRTPYSVHTNTNQHKIYT